MITAYIGIGSNLGDRQQNIKKALGLLAGLDKTKLGKVSESIETAPVGPPGQEKYLNAAVELETGLSPEGLLKGLKEIEKKLGRKDEGPRWGPREIDLDILFYGDNIISREGLEIPHPRLHERTFVLEPLSQIAPSFIHPKLKESVLQLLADLDEEL